MKRFDNPLDSVKIAAPCPANWDEMFAFKNNNVRFCDQCKKNVYNLSGMTQREAVNLITQTEDRLCVRFYRRSDGTILTQNCPVGLRALKRKAQWGYQFLFGVTMSLLTLIGSHWLIKFMENRNSVMGAMLPTGDVARPRNDAATILHNPNPKIMMRREIGDIPPPSTKPTPFPTSIAPGQMRAQIDRPEMTSKPSNKILKPKKLEKSKVE